MTTPPPPPPGPNDPWGRQPWGQQPGWGTPGYGAPPGYPVPRAYGYVREHPSGTTVLVLGILGLVLCQVLAPIAWVMGHRARREMNREPQVQWTNRGNVTAGWVCGIVGTVLLLLVIAYVVLIITVIATGRRVTSRSTRHSTSRRPVGVIDGSS